jgi:hypothetical protein
VVLNLTFSKKDDFVKSQKIPVIVIPVKTGIQENQLLMDSRFRGSDGFGDFLRVCQESVYKKEDLQ